MASWAEVVVERDEAVVRFLEVEDNPGSIAAGWTALEAVVGSMRGRHFLASVADGRYRACVEVAPDVSDEELALPMDVVPGGAFRRIRLRGEPPEVYDQIGPAAAQLGSRSDLDPARPLLELYRRRDVVDVLAPVC